jgi:hypothetical protein
MMQLGRWYYCKLRNDGGDFHSIALLEAVSNEFLQGWVVDHVAIVVTTANPQQHPRK